MAEQKIDGYRELSPSDLVKINDVKENGARLNEIILGIVAHTKNNPHLTEDQRNEAYRWAAIAQTDFQKGMMAAVRSIALPTGF